MSSADPVRVVEAAYRWVPDESSWLEQLLEAAAPFAVGTGIAAYSVALGSEPAVGGFIGRDTPSTFEHDIRAFTRSLGHAAREMYAPTEFLGNAAYRLRRIAQARGVTVDALTRGQGGVRAWALVGGDPRSRAVTLAFPATSSMTPEDAFPGARVLGLVAAHISAALRLRVLAAPIADVDGVTESVLSPGGKVLHAVGEATSPRAKDSLVEAVVRRERARGTLRRVDSEEAAELWSVLVSGRWSIVDFVDRDGKRLLLARKNPLESPDVIALTRDESDVLWLATQGHSRKYIAYELGISVAQVGRRLLSAQRKLRVSSRRELLQRFGGT